MDVWTAWGSEVGTAGVGDSVQAVSKATTANNGKSHCDLVRLGFMNNLLLRCTFESWESHY